MIDSVLRRRSLWWMGLSLVIFSALTACINFRSVLPTPAPRVTIFASGVMPVTPGPELKFFDGGTVPTHTSTPISSITIFTEGTPSSTPLAVVTIFTNGLPTRTPVGVVTFYTAGVSATAPGPVVTIFPTADPNAVYTQGGVPVTVFPTPSITPTPTQTHTPTQTPTSTPTQTSTPTPTPTLSPLAARINGSINITKESLAAELQRVIAANSPRTNQPITPSAQLRREVLDQMIQAALIEDVAIRQGAQLDELTEAELNKIVSVRGGMAQFSQWLRDTGQQELDVRLQARRQSAARSVANVLFAAVITQTEQIRASHILVANEAEASAILTQLAAGIDFAEMARVRSLDPSTRGVGGDLSWIAPGAGSLAWSELEAYIKVAPVGIASKPIKSPIGFHILKIVAREVRTLSPADLARVREDSLSQWLAQLRNTAQVEYFP